jgi:NAD(P)-dependent dehydrogenase (short-subunit alcohol dehydrogenase family)
VLAARSEAELNAVAARIRKAGGQAATLVLDLADLVSIDGLAKRIGEKLGRLDVVVANHGVLGPIAPLAAVEDADFDKVIQVNLTATWRLLRALDPLLRASPSGRALLVTSGATQGAMADWGAYAASKAGLEALARAYGAETRSSRVRVNLVDPGEVRTGMRAAAFPDEDPNRLPTPEEIAGVFVRLASPACAFSGARVPATVEV